MAREMSNSNNGVSGEDIVGDAYLWVYRLIDPYLSGGVSADPIGDDNGGINYGVVKPVLNGRRNMGDRFLPCTRVERVSIGKKGLSSTCLDRIHDPSDKDRPDEGGVPPLAEVKFYSHQVVGFDLILDFSPLQKFTHLVQHHSFAIASEIGEKDRAVLHGISFVEVRLG